MINEEFNAWVKRLFVAFPSMHQWLRQNSPDPQETQRLWRNTLSPYTAAECGAVLDSWTSGELPPPEAYERDNIHLHVRAVIELRRSRARKRRESIEERQRREAVRVGGEHSPQSSIIVGTMARAVAELSPLWKQVKAGELDQFKYEVQRDEIIDRHFAEEGEACTTLGQ